VIELRPRCSESVRDTHGRHGPIESCRSGAARPTPLWAVGRSIDLRGRAPPTRTTAPDA